MKAFAKHAPEVLVSKANLLHPLPYPLSNFTELTSTDAPTNCGKSNNIITSTAFEQCLCCSPKSLARHDFVTRGLVGDELYWRERAWWL